MIANVRYADAQNKTVMATIEGVTLTCIPLDSDSQIPNRVREWIDAGNTPAAYVVPTPPTIADIYDDQVTMQRVLKAAVLALNDGSFVPGSNRTGAQLKAIVLAKM